MDVLAVTEVNAHVVCAAAPKYEVARLQIREGYKIGRASCRERV